MRRWIVWGVVLAVLGAALWYFLRTRPVLVDTARVARGALRHAVEEEGRTRVKERFLVSAPVSGRMLRVELDEGDRVEAGALLATIDALELSSRVEEAEGRLRALHHRLEGVSTLVPKEEEIERAQVLERRAEEALDVARRELGQSRAALEKAGKDYERVSGLARSGAATEEAVDAAELARVQAREAASAAEARVEMRELEIRAARLETEILDDRRDDYDWQEADYAAQIAALQASLQALRDDLLRTRITAPAAGVVLQVLTESEQFVAPGSPIVEIGDLGDMEVIADFLSEDAAHMRVGMKAELFGRALEEEVVPATVERVYPSGFTKISSLGVEQQRVNVIFAFDEKDADLGDQYRVEVRVVRDEREDAVLVPEGALFRLEDEWHVFKMTDGRARLTKVEVGLRDGRRREVLSGLTPGDTVVLHPGDAVTDGSPLEPIG